MVWVVWSATALLGCPDKPETGTPPGTTTETGTPTDTVPPDACDDDPGAILCDGDVAITCDGVGDIVDETTCLVPEELCVPDLGCGRCLDLEVPYVDLDVALGTGVTLHPVDGVDADSFAWLRFKMHPLQLRTDLPEGSVQVLVDGPLAVYGADGTEVNGGVSAAGLSTLLVAGTAVGSGSVTLETPCGVSHTVPFVVRPDAGLAGRELGGFPWFDRPRTFTSEETVQLALDPHVYPDRVGEMAVAWIVPHRTAEEWAADPTLADAVYSPQAVEVGAGSIADNIFDIWNQDKATWASTGLAYDMVVDFGGDGTLDPGDLVDGVYEPGFYVIGDLTVAGSLPVATVTYSGGSWLGQRTYYPANVAGLGELPLVVISHGNGHDYTWYDYLGEHLASYGYVVMSHQNNTGPGIPTASETTLENTEYFLDNLDDIDNGVLEGHIDGSRIAWIGHSRGGEGVAHAYDQLVDGTFVSGAYGPDDILVVSSIAPTVFEPMEDTNPHTVPYHLIAGAADGDVSGAPDCPQCQYFQISENAKGVVHTTYMQGVGHNEFNCCGFNDARGPDLIGREETQVFAKSEYLALLEYYLMGNEATFEVFTRMYEDFRPVAVSPDIILSRTFQDAQESDTLVLDDYQTEDSVEVASSGAVVVTDAREAIEDVLEDGDNMFGWTGGDPMNGMTQGVGPDAEARGLMFEWTTGEEPYLEIDIPEGSEDLTGYRFLSLRACQGTRHPETVALDAPLHFTVALVDGVGVSSSIDFAEYGMLTEPYARVGEGSGEGWANEFATVRLRLLDFTNDGSGLDLSDIRTVRLDFGGSFGSDRGRVGLDDIEITVR